APGPLCERSWDGAETQSSVRFPPPSARRSGTPRPAAAEQNAHSRKSESGGRTGRKSSPGHSKARAECLESECGRSRKLCHRSLRCAVPSTVSVPSENLPSSEDYINLFGSGYAGLGSNPHDLSGV